MRGCRRVRSGRIVWRLRRFGAGLSGGARRCGCASGAHGAVLFHPEGLFALPAYPVTQVQDPTGAGDSFAGALIGALAAAGDTGFATLRRALAYATVTASLTVEALGVDRLETAGRALIDQRFTELVRMTRID